MFKALWNRFVHEPVPDVAPAMKHGFISVTNGVVSVQGPSNGGYPARINPVNGIDVHVNGVLITEPTDLLPEDSVSLVPTVTLPAESRYQLQMAADKMQVTLTVNALGTYAVADEAKVDIFTPKLTMAVGTSVTAPEIGEALTKKGITYGVDHDAIAAAIEAAGEPYAVALGVPVVHGHSTKLDWVVTEPVVEPDSDERIDFREQPTPLTVEADAVIARVIKATAGKRGINVLGESVPCAGVREVEIVPGLGVTLMRDGALVAQRSGRPVCIETKSRIRLRVIPVFEHRGDVDLASGNLRVKGDVFIFGDVTENMEVSATGDVTITGNVTRGQIRAGGSITVYSICIGSWLTAGGAAPWCNTLAPTLTRLDQLLSTLQQAIGRRMKMRNMRAEEFDQRSLATLVQSTVEQEVPDLPKVAGEAVRLAAHVTEFDDELGQSLASLRQSPLLDNRIAQMHSLAELIQAKHLVDQIRAKIDAEYLQEAHIRVGSCENSLLESTGNVQIGKVGAYLSTVRAHRLIRVWGPVIGGAMRTHDRIEIRQAGNAAGVPTLLEVAEAGTILAEWAFPGVESRSGKVGTKVQNPGPLVRRVTVSTAGSAHLQRRSG